MGVDVIDPLGDCRWEIFLASQLEASVFHTPAWLAALARTYKYEPAVYAIEDGGRLVAGIPFCKVTSCITGRRLVSLPFSDHCQPLVRSPEQLKEILTAVESEAQRERLKYVEVRPLWRNEDFEAAGAFHRSDGVFLHMLDIARPMEELLHGFHLNSIRRNIAKAEREELQYEEGRSEDLLRTFYALLLMTRRRHCIPPQPLKWFRHLIDCFGDALKIRVASKDRTPIASIITLSFHKTITYKYSCSDPKYNALGGTIFLLWRAIQDARNEGLSQFDFGRSDPRTPGLITFKDRWGGHRIAVNYYRSGATAPLKSDSRLAAAAKRLLPSVPDPMLSALGGLLYRHVG